MVLFAGIGASSLTMSQQAQAQVTAPAGDDEARRFLTLLQEGKGAQAIDNIMRSSPLYAQKAGLKQSLLGQMDAALGAYGPVTSFEKLGTTSLGTLVTRQRYLVQHREMVVRWEFQMIRTASGWRVGHFGFDDQIGSWFADAK